MINGYTKIELFNAENGELIHKQEKHNLVTNYIQDAFNGLGAQMRRSQLSSGVCISDIANKFTPIYQKTIGGVVAFANQIQALATNTSLPIDQPAIASASGEYSGTDTWRGTLNTNESGLVYNGDVAVGYKYVWDFGTDKGNGNISTICLTNAEAGKKPLSIPDAATIYSEVQFFDNELTVMPNPMDRSLYADSNYILAINGNDIFYTTGTKVYKVSVINPTVSVVNTYTALSNPVEVATYDFTISKSFVMPDGLHIGVVTTSSTAFTIYSISIVDWTYTTTTINYLSASSYGDYIPYFNGSKLFLFSKSNATRVLVISTSGETLLSKTITTAYESAYIDLAQHTIYKDGFVVFAFPCGQSKSGRCLAVNENTLEIKYNLCGLSRYISSWSYSNWYLQIACPDVKSPYVLFQKTAATDTAQTSVTLTKSVVALTFGDPMITIQNLATPITKTSDMNMKITYEVREQ